jgi:hypothetical protein
MENKLELKDLKELMVSDGMVEAEIVKSKLDSFGVPCMLKFESAGRLMGITMDGLGKVQVMVPAEYLAEAKEIISTGNDEENGEQTE